MKIEMGRAATPAASAWEQRMPPDVLPDVDTSTANAGSGFVNGVIVPLVQALVTGALVAGLVVFGLNEVLPHIVGDAWTLWCWLTLAIAGVVWPLLLWDTRRLLWGVERMLGLDLDHDGHHGNPQRTVLTVEVQAGQTKRYVDTDWLDVEIDQLVTFARGVLGGMSLAEASWGGVFGSVPAYKQFRARMTEAGMLRLVNPQAPSQGFEATPAGRALCERIVEYADNGH